MTMDYGLSESDVDLFRQAMYFTEYFVTIDMHSSIIVSLISPVLTSVNRTWIDRIMQNHTVNNADGECSQAVDVKFCKNWYVYFLV